MAGGRAGQRANSLEGVVTVRQATQQLKQQIEDDWSATFAARPLVEALRMRGMRGK